MTRARTIVVVVRPRVVGIPNQVRRVYRDCRRLGMEAGQARLVAVGMVMGMGAGTVRLSIERAGR